MPEDSTPISHLTVVPGVPPEFSDEALALRFAAAHEYDLRYVAPWNQWYEWDGTRWKRDRTLHVRDLARAVCRAASAECRDARRAEHIASGTTVAAVEKLAKADRRLAATTEQWDCNKWLLNTPGGTIDLRTGEMQKHRRSEYCTKITAVTPGGTAPHWNAFLDRVTCGDPELARYIRRMAGYVLTGVTRDQVLFFIHGEGGNGKSVFLNALAGAMRTYSKIAPIETFLTGSYDRHPTELARLRGARFVVASEADRDRLLNESRIKSLTGGDTITARFMREDFFEFIPEFKLVLVGNDKPRFSVVNDAIRRRLNIIPFNARIAPEEVDKALSEKLQKEWPGILAWMIAGCLEWQDVGLSPPPSVIAATVNCLEESDTLGDWLEARCSRRTGAWTLGSDLFGSWSEHVQALGGVPGSARAFAAQMQAHGFPASKKHKGRGFCDVILTDKEVRS